MKRIAPLVVIGVLCALAIYRWSIEPMRCNAAISEQMSRWLAVEQTASDYDRTVRARRNLADLDRIDERCAAHPNVHVLIGMNQRVLGRREEALAAFRKSLDVAGERPELRVMEGEVLAEMGRVDEAVRSFVLATRYNPLLPSYISPDIAQRVEAELQRK